MCIRDRSIAYSEGNVSEDLVKEMIGLNDPTQILDLLKLIIEGRTEDSLKKLKEVLTKWLSV